MAVTNLYSNLPGHLVEFKDGGLQLTSTTTDTSSTKSLLILGTALDGPINEPVKIDAVTVSQVFGKEVDADGYPNGTTLTKYAKQAFKNGFDDVRCMRVTGSQAYTTIYGHETVGYETASEEIDGAEATDGTGIINSNSTAFSKDYSNETSPIYVIDKAIMDGSDRIDGIYINDGTERIIGLGSTSGGASEATWSPYHGFSIDANKFGKLNKLALKCKAIKFVGATSDPSSNYSFTTVNESVTETSGNLDPIVFTVSSTSIAGGTLELFTDTSAHGTLNGKLPDVTGIDPSGFIVKVNGTPTPLKEGTDQDYTGSYDSTAGTYTITPTASGQIKTAYDADPTVEVSITYYPYEEVTIDEDFTTEFNALVADSTLDVSEGLAKKDAEITSVTVGTDVFLTTSAEFTDKFEISGGKVKVIDPVGMTPGSVIKAAYSWSKEIVSDLKLKIKSQWGGSLYKDGKVQVKKMIDGTTNFTVIEFTAPSAKGGKKFSYSSKYYTTIDDLVLAMKNDTNNVNMFEIEIVKGEGTDALDLLVSTDVLDLSEGGEDGIKVTNNEMFEALSGVRYTAADIGSPISAYTTDVVTSDMVGYLKTQGAYQILENYNVDFIYPAGVYADSVQTVNPNSDFQRELALVCAVLTYRTKMTHGFIDVKPNSNTTLVGTDAYVNKLINSHPNIYYMTDSDGNVIYDADSKPMDIGWYTSCVVGPEPVMTSDTLGTYYGSPAIAYAALNSVLEPQSSPMNKALRNVNGMKFKFSNKQMDMLLGSRFVCFKLKNEGLATASSTPYVVDGITSGAPNCDYHDIVVVKVITDVVDQIRKVADPFIGEQNTVEQRNALSALIAKRLAKLVEIGEIQSYEFEVSATIQQQLIGEASIALTIVPALTLRKITTVVALRAAE